MIRVIQQWLLGTLRRQLVTGVVLVHAVLMTLFIVDMVRRETTALEAQQIGFADALAKSVATSSAVWLLSRDVAGLQEIIEAQRRHPSFLFGMVLDKHGLVLAHSDSAYRGKYVTNLPSSPTSVVLHLEHGEVQALSPVMLAGGHIGWVRIALLDVGAGESRAAVILHGVVYAFVAILVGAILAVLMAKKLTSRLDKIEATSALVAQGKTDARVNLAGGDEAARLARSVDGMLDALARAEEEMKASHLALIKAQEQLMQLNVELEQRVRLRTEELEELNREQKAFSYSVSHDLRAPLRSIDAFSEILLRDYSVNLDATGRDYLTRVRAGASRMGRLIDDLLSLTRVTSLPMRLSRVNLSDMVNELLAELQGAEPRRRVETQVEPDIVVTGDAGLLRVVLQNLLSNAWKFTRNTPLSIIAFGRGEDEVGNEYFFVRDNGAGFDMRFADKLFGAFQRLHSQREYGGTGIGLATVQRIVTRHHGKVWGNASPGAGATFYFTLHCEEVDYV